MPRKCKRNSTSTVINKKNENKTENNTVSYENKNINCASSKQTLGTLTKDFEKLKNKCANAQAENLNLRSKQKNLMQVKVELARLLKASDQRIKQLEIERYNANQRYEILRASVLEWESLQWQEECAYQNKYIYYTVPKKKSSAAAVFWRTLRQIAVHQVLSIFIDSIFAEISV